MINRHIVEFILSPMFTLSNFMSNWMLKAYVDNRYHENPKYA